MEVNRVSYLEPFIYPNYFHVGILDSASKKIQKSLYDAIFIHKYFVNIISCVQNI